MPIGARGELAALLLTGLLGIVPAHAQSTPSSSWTDPPNRGSAAPVTPPAAEVEPEAPVAVKPAETVAAPDRTATPDAKPDAVAEVRPPPRSAKLRRDRIRSAAVRANRDANSRPHHRSASFYAYDRPRARTRIAERPRVHADRYDTRRYGYDRRYAPRVVSAYPPRRAGWGGLIGTERDRRIAEAREAGYIVVRSRTYADPYGIVARSFRPLDPDEFE